MSPITNPLTTLIASFEDQNRSQAGGTFEPGTGSPFPGLLPVPGAPAANNPISAASAAIGGFANLSATRITAFVLGIICIIAGLLMLKPVSNVVVQVASTAKDAAKTAARTAEVASA